MPLPFALKNKSYVVFCYTTDLVKAAGTLAKFIGCKSVRIVLKKGTIAGSSDEIPTMGEVAWLVGHGLSTDSRVGSLQRGTYVEISVLLDWLVGEGYSAVVDTCCQPNLRRLVAAEYPIDYYSCPDDLDVYQIHQYPSLDHWWETCQMALRSTGPDEESD